MINKKTKIKIMAQLLLATSIIGIGTGYNFIPNQTITVHAMYDGISGSKIKKFVSSVENSAFIKEDGTVWTVGKNTAGQLGIGISGDNFSPVQVPISNVNDVGLGIGHTVFLKNDGTVWATGNNSCGQLGIGNTTAQSSPIKIPIDNVKEIKVGGTYTVYVKNDGTIWYSGRFLSETTSTPIQVSITDVKDIICGSQHIMFLKNDGTVYGIGLNTDGQLGIGSTTNQSSLVKVSIDNVKTVKCGTYSTVFLKNDGTVWATGTNDYGQLGVGTTYDITTPAQIPISDVVDLSAGWNHIVFLKNDNTVWGVGSTNAFLGNNTQTVQKTPVKINISDVKHIHAGSENTIFVKNDDTLYGTGHNLFGQLSLGYSTNTTYILSIVPLSSRIVNKTSYTLDKIYNNLSDFGLYGSLSTTIYGKSIYDGGKPVTYTNEMNTTILGNISVEDSALKIKKFLPNGSLVTVDNYGSVQYYSTIASTVMNVPIDGTMVSNVVYGMLNQTPIVMLYKTDGSIYYFNPSESGLPIRMLPINQTDFKNNYVYQDKNAVAKYYIFEKNNGDLIYYDSNRVEKATGINTNNVKNIIPSTTNNSTMYLMTDGTIKYLNTSGIATNVTLPTGLSVQSLLSNRFIQMSDGFIYALNNNAVTATNVLGTATQSTLNNILWMKNGTIQTLSSSGTMSTVTDINGTMIKTIVPLDNNNAYILNKDNSTYGIGSLVGTTDLLSKGINYSDIAGFISNNDSSFYGKLLIMNDGTVYTYPSGWFKSNYIKFDGNAISQVKNEMAVPFTDALTQATNAVVTAETDKTQVSLDYARGLVNALPSSADKTALIARLDALQLIINASSQINVATQAVTKAENTKLQSDVDLAQTEVNKLTDGIDKTALQVRLDAVKNATALTNATQAVVKAEGSKLQSDVDSTKTLVNALPDSTDKTDLTKRLDAIQTIINNQTQANADLLDAQTKVTNAESTKAQSDIDIAQTAINKLPSGTDKTNLQTRLDKVKTDLNNQTQANADLLDAQTKVTNAESTKTQSDIDVAQTAINKLPSGTDKTNLQTRLDKVKADLVSNDASKITEATNAVAKAEGSKVQSDVDSAKTLVNALPTGTDKTDLTKRLDVVQAEIDKTKQDALDAQKLKDAQDAVTKADTTKAQTDLTKAQTSVNTLPNGTEKTNLQNILDKIKQEIADKAKQDAYNNQLSQATALVTTAEGTKDTYDILKAQSAVSSLPSGSDKDSLQSRLDNLKAQKAKDDQIKADTREATMRVQIAEASVNLSSVKTYIANAQTAIDKLPSCTEKTGLQDRLNKITTQISANANKSLAMQAEPLVRFAELFKTTTYKNKAWAVVNQMTDCDAKTNFVNRLNAIK